MDRRYASGAPYHSYGLSGYTNSDIHGLGYDMSTPPSALSSLLDKVPLGSDEENSRLLDLVDRLRECRVDQFIDLPQVVAVGDQSSGKSSVLEALTQLPFPRDSIQCTRYVTQIRLRRDTSLTETKTKASIIAYNRARDQKRYDAFEHYVDEDSDFGEIFQRATELIFSEGSKDFLSKDILSIERVGPKLAHLTVVDLPGIIHNPTRTQTAADVDAIAELSRQFMSKERTIILPIVGCDAEYAKQVIVRRCKEADPAGIRTLGVITKPDMTLTPQREEMFLDLACNMDDRNKLQLGWHVLRNRAHDEMNLTSKERDAEEKKYFANSNWGKKVDPNQLGVEALRKKLSTQLIRHVAGEVFKVQRDIESQLQQCRAKLEKMGPGWETVEQMRQELHLLCKRSAGLTQAAIQGQGINPLGEDFFPRFNEGTKRYSRNLRSRVVIRNEQFSDSLENYGSSCIIEGEGGDMQPPKFLSKPNMSGMPPIVTRSDFIEKEVRPLIQDNPGQETSVDINPLLVYRLFQLYSRNWPDIADTHVTAIYSLCEEFLAEVMSYAWPTRIQNRVWRGFVECALEERWKNAQEELERLKKDRFRYVRTYHSSYDKSYYQKRKTPEGPAEVTPQSKYEDTLNKMLLHYEHQLPTFISNIIIQVIERHLIDGMEEVFERERVLKLSDNEIRQLMEEDYNTRNERSQLKDQRDVLQKGLDICREIACRPDLGPYENQVSRLADTRPLSFRSQTGQRIQPPPLPSRRFFEASAFNQPQPEPSKPQIVRTTSLRHQRQPETKSPLNNNRKPVPESSTPQQQNQQPLTPPSPSHPFSQYQLPTSGEDEEEAFQRAIRASLVESRKGVQGESSTMGAQMGSGSGKKDGNASGTASSAVHAPVNRNDSKGKKTGWLDNVRAAYS